MLATSQVSNTVPNLFWWLITDTESTLVPSSPCGAPKHRKDILTGAREKRLRELLYQKAKEIKAEIRALEIMADHVHLFVASDPTMVTSEVGSTVQRIRLPPTSGRISLVEIVSPEFVESFVLHRKRRCRL